MHAGLFVGTLMTPSRVYCYGKNYGNIVPVLACCHGFNALRYFVDGWTPDLVLKHPHSTFRIRFY